MRVITGCHPAQDESDILQITINEADKTRIACILVTLS
jgi:hypothetical protein